uniref:Uncharacterized protein n=1 Tax=Noccaea caerulescens TaxID=107243 RepID=A0A1J3GRR0_NOCCA
MKKDRFIILKDISYDDVLKHKTTTNFSGRFENVFEYRSKKVTNKKIKVNKRKQLKREMFLFLSCLHRSQSACTS